MAYVNIPTDLSKIKSKIAFSLTKRQLICFGCAALTGIPAYLFTRAAIGNTGAMLLMIALMLPAFLLAMYERDGLPAEKVVRNIIRAKFIRPGIRPYKTENFYQWIVDSEKLTVMESPAAINQNRRIATPSLSTINSQLSTKEWEDDSVEEHKKEKQPAAPHTETGRSVTLPADGAADNTLP